LSFLVTQPLTTPLYTLSLHDALPILAIALTQPLSLQQLIKGIEAPMVQLTEQETPEVGNNVVVHHGPVLVECCLRGVRRALRPQDRKSTRLNSSHVKISYAVFCLKKK